MPKKTNKTKGKKSAKKPSAGRVRVIGFKSISTRKAPTRKKQ